MTSVDDTTAPSEQRRSGARRADLDRSLVTLGSSLLAVVVAFAISALLLAVTGKDPVAAFSTLIDVATNTDKLYETVWRSMPLIFSATAFAITAKLGLFNIGVEGQYLMGMFWAAVIAAEVDLPAVIHLPFAILVGAAAGAAWGAIAGILKVKRGVNEVISTIMLNAIALQLIDWWFNDFFKFDDESASLDVRTKTIPESGWMPDIIPGDLNGFVVVVLLVAVVYWVLVFKSRFGFRLRASGLNPGARPHRRHQCQPDDPRCDADLGRDRRPRRPAPPAR